MATKRKSPKKRATATKRSSRRRSHHAPVTVDQKLDHLLYMQTLIAKRDRQALREGREQTADVISHATALTAAIEHAEHMLAVTGHEIPAPADLTPAPAQILEP